MVGERDDSQSKSKVSMAASAGNSGWSCQIPTKATSRFHEAAACSFVSPCMLHRRVSVKDHRRDLFVCGQAQGCDRAAGFALKRSRFGDACRDETDQPCDLVLSDPFHSYPLRLMTLFVCGGANYRTAVHSSPHPKGSCS